MGWAGAWPRAMTGATLDTGALIALESGSTRMAVLVEEALANRAELAVPAGVLAQAWRGGRRQARIARLLRASNTFVIPLDTKAGHQGWTPRWRFGWVLGARRLGRRTLWT